MHDFILLSAFLFGAPQEAGAPDWGQRITWSREAGPPSREHAAFVLDSERSRAILLSGSGYEPYGTPLADAWSFDLGDESWRPLDLAGDAFAPGGSRRSAVIAGGAFLYGGYGAGFAPQGELWQLEFETDQILVKSVVQESAPPARFLHAFACDPTGQRFVVFGGLGAGDAFDDTWLGTRTAEGVRWQALETELDPGKRFGFAFAHDVERGRLLVCGGQVPPEDGQIGMVVVRDLWALDFTTAESTWTRLASYDEDEFPGRRNPAFTFDESGKDPGREEDK